MNNLTKPPFTQEQIEWLDKNYGRHKDSDSVRDFRREIALWVESVATRNVSKTTIQNGLYAAIKLKTGIRSMNGLSDESLSKAKAVFETFKKDFG